MPPPRPNLVSLTRLVLVWLALIWAGAIAAQIQQPSAARTNIQGSLVAEGVARPGETLLLAIQFRPNDGWHGYWKNPGDAGYGMELTWNLPEGWTAGESQYPVPETLLISGLMNHVYKGDYAVLIPVSVPADASPGLQPTIAVDGQWLACTDVICVPEQGRFETSVLIGGEGATDQRFANWQAAIPPLIDSEATFGIAENRLRIAIPLPETLAVGDPHLFVEQTDLVRYADRQKFMRDGDLLIAEIPLRPGAALPEKLSGILSFGDGEGIRFEAGAGSVPQPGTGAVEIGSDTPSLAWLLVAALAGGLLLNVMPCVFPILSLKALSLARSGESAGQARNEALAYTAGVVLACLVLGAALLLLRSAGEQVGWAFQLQEPAVVVALLVLAVAITANLAGLFALPSVTLTRSGKPASAFATGLLAAIAATPCTGPFMAAALGAALLLPPLQAMALFAFLGVGLALPFLLIGFVPALRNRLPKPGPWMERFRKAMAIPMGLTALALIWLMTRLGGQGFALVALITIAGLVIGLAVVGRLQQGGKMAWPAFGLIAAPFLIFAAFALPASYERVVRAAPESLLDPVPYSLEALAEARASGKPVFIWFTADWCLSCKVNERVAIEREATKDAFDQAGVIAMRGDWTRRDPEISQYLSRRGAAGVPLYVWYEPRGAAETLPQVLSPQMLLELARRQREPAAQVLSRPLREADGRLRSSASGAGSD